MSLKTFQAKLDNISSTVKVVSFDVFDTLLFRLVSHKFVAYMAADELSRLLKTSMGVDIPGSEILESRFEYKRNMDRAYFFREAEWTLSCWLSEFSNKKSINEIRLKEFAKEAEIISEKKSLRMLYSAHEILSLARMRGLRVIALSDMWLDQEWLKELLEQFGLFLDEVFTSGSLGVSKRRGSIFRKIEMLMQLESNAFLHIGDNLKADFIRPSMSNWKSIWSPRPGHVVSTRAIPLLTFNQRKKDWQAINAALEIQPARSNKPFYDMAYNHLAVLLLIFSIVQWRRFRSQRINVAYYLARDAKLMLDVYDRISHLLYGSCPRRYVRLTRKTVAIAHPKCLLENVKHIAGKIGRKKVYQWLDNFTISPQLRRDILATAGINEHEAFSEQSRTSLLEACRELSREIKLEQSIQIDMIRNYLFQESEGISCQRVGIVDSGWACTIQDSIQAILGEAELVSGMYFGVSTEGMEPNKRNLKYGILRDDFRNRKHYNSLESSAGVIRLWDTILREPSGTAIGFYRNKRDNVIPVLDNAQTIGRFERKAAREIQKGITEGTTARMQGVSLIVDLNHLLSDSDFEIAANMVAKRISTYPSLKLAKTIMRINFDEGKGASKLKTLGDLESVQSGVAWYPGILASMGMQCLTPLLKAAVTLILRKRRKFK